MPYVWGTGEGHTGFWCGELRRGDNLEDLCVDGSELLKKMFKN
jgi:hypothetical protein